MEGVEDSCKRQREHAVATDDDMTEKLQNNNSKIRETERI